MKHKNVKVGQRVIIKRSTSAIWPEAAEHIGEEFRVIVVEPLDYCDGGGATVRVEAVLREWPFRSAFWCNHRDLKRVKEEAPERDELSWPWPKGTPVTLTEEGHVHCDGYLRGKGIALDTPLFLGSDWSDIPPLETADGNYVCYADETYVKRK